SRRHVRLDVIRAVSDRCRTCCSACARPRSHGNARSHNATVPLSPDHRVRAPDARALSPDGETHDSCLESGRRQRIGSTGCRFRDSAQARMSQARSPEERRAHMKHRILIVEDDAVFLRPLLRVVEAEGYEVRAVQNGEAALDLLRHEDFDLVLTDKLLPKMDGIELVRQIKAGHPEVAVVVMTAHATVESAVEALRLGAVDFLLKPFELTEAVLGVRHAIELQDLRLAKGARVRRNQEQFSFDRIVTQSEGMREVFELVRSVVELDTTVLIEGETGVGKELL